MGQQANSGKNASLNRKPERAAGRAARTGQKAPGQEAIVDASESAPPGGKTNGAFGKNNHANRHAQPNP